MPSPLTAVRPGRPSTRPAAPSKAQAFRWNGSVLSVLEQKDLPHKIRYISCRTHRQAADSIRDMSVRGAPAIGCVAAFGLALAAREKKFPSPDALVSHLEAAKTSLAATRPTAVNLFWALERMSKVWRNGSARPGTAGRNFQPALAAALEREARAVADEDLAACRRMGDLGAALLGPGSVVLTHCNAGALATAGHGTALGVVRSAHAAGKIRKVFVDETRPYLQGARLTAWECLQEGIPHELITDNMAGHFMKTGGVTAVIVGADRIAANGDTANKIGTYSLAVLARHHRIPFYVAAPLSTVDLKTPSGERIPIEERSHAEVVYVGRSKTAISPKGTPARHPAFDVTPGDLISAIVTERGVARPPYAQTLPALF